jgi:hypothetical protein
VIRFSAALVAVAIGVLIGGIATSKLLLVYIAIAVSAVALVGLVIGVVLKREELFGEGQGLVPAAAGAGPVLPARAGDRQGTGDSEGKAASSGYVAPPPPAAGAAAGYGVPFGGVGQATASPGAGLSATRQAAARHGWSAEPVPPWETAATRESWAPDRMPAGKDQRAVSGDGVRAPSAWQDTAPVTAAGHWGVPDAGAPKAGAPNADTRAAAAPPRSWAAPPTMPVPSTAPAVKPDAGSGAATPSWFDRLGEPTGTDTPSVPSASAPGSGSGWPWSGRDAGPPGGPVAQEEPAASTAGSGDEDDDWPTRYSWLDDETDQTDESGEAGKDDRGDDKAGKVVDEAEATVAASEASPVAESESPAPAETNSDAKTKASAAPKASAPAASASAKAREAKTAGQVSVGQETADEETKDAAAGEPANVAGETGGNVIAFRSRKEPEEPSPASDADQEAVPANETAEAEAERDAEVAAEPEDEPPAAATAADGTALVAVVRGVPRYHEPDCVLIRFMPEGDLRKLTVPQAKEDGCTPCAACQPTG